MMYRVLGALQYYLTSGYLHGQSATAVGPEKNAGTTFLNRVKGHNLLCLSYGIIIGLKGSLLNTGQA